MPRTADPSEIFSREDLAKPENRANVWLLACLSIEPFRMGLLKLLDLPEACVLQPMIWPSQSRPDYTATLDGSVHAIVECEAGSRDLNQLGDYGTKFPKVPLRWILGQNPEKGDVLWDQVSSLALILKSEVNPQQAANLDLLMAVIADLLGRGPKGRSRWISMSDRLPQDGWFSATFGPLLELRQHGMIGATANTDAHGSFSLRLLKPRSFLLTSTRTGLGLAAMRASEPGIVDLPGPDHLRKHLAPSLHDWVDTWEALLLHVEPKWSINSRRNGRADLRVTTVIKNANAFSDCYRNLATRLLNH